VLSRFEEKMDTTKKTLIAILIVTSILLSGCTEVSNETTDEIEDNIPLPDCELDNSCIDDTLDNGENEVLTVTQMGATISIRFIVCCHFHPMLFC